MTGQHEMDDSSVENSLRAATEEGVQAIPEEIRPDAAMQAVQASVAAAVRAAPDDEMRPKLAADVVQAATAAAVGAVPNEAKKDVTVAAVRAATEAGVEAAPADMRQEVREAVADSGTTEAVTRFAKDVRDVLSKGDRDAFYGPVPPAFHGHLMITIDSASPKSTRRVEDKTFFISAEEPASLNLTVTISTTPVPEAAVHQQLDVSGDDQATEVTFLVVPDLVGALLVPLEARAVVTTFNGFAAKRFHTQGAVEPGDYEGYVEILLNNACVATSRFLVVTSKPGE